MGVLLQVRSLERAIRPFPLEALAQPPISFIIPLKIPGTRYAAYVGNGFL